MNITKIPSQSFVISLDSKTRTLRKNGILKAKRALVEPKRARAIFSRESKIKKKRSDVRLTPKCLQGQSSIVAMKLLTKSFSKWLWLACFRAVGRSENLVGHFVM